MLLFQQSTKILLFPSFSSAALKKLAQNLSFDKQSKKVLLHVATGAQRQTNHITDDTPTSWPTIPPTIVIAEASNV